MAVGAKPEVEIWWRPKKINFLTQFPIRSFRQFLAKTYRFTTIQNVTDDRQTTQCPKGATYSTVGQKQVQELQFGNACFMISYSHFDSPCTLSRQRQVIVLCMFVQIVVQ